MSAPYGMFMLSIAKSMKKQFLTPQTYLQEIKPIISVLQGTTDPSNEYNEGWAPARKLYI